MLEALDLNLDVNFRCLMLGAEWALFWLAICFIDQSLNA